MSNLPVIRSKEQIIGDLIDGFLARVSGVNDLSRNSVLTQFFNAVGQVNFKAYADIITMLDAMSVDRAVGEALQRIAKDKNVPILSGSASTGKVTLTDLSFNRVASTIFTGQPAPVAGSQKVYLSDASKFSSTGSIYIGRKTPNVEGPLAYISVQPEGGGAYWSLTLSPTSLTTKYHNTGEEVVMAQGGKRYVTAGTIVQTAQGQAITSATFKTVSQALILDGETSTENIPVVCTEIGVKGNIPKGAIREAMGLPFEASVTNPTDLSNGTAPDTDDVLRSRIKEYEQTKSKGTESAIQLSSLNVIAQDELKKVLTSAISRYADSSAALIFDDGTGYEPVFQGVGLEQIVDEALGGEQDLQLRQKPIAQARVKNNILGPYSMSEGLALSVTIKGDTRVNYFVLSDFKVPTSSTTTEIVNSINSNPNFHAYASTAKNQSYLVLYPRDRYQNDIKVNSVSSSDANAVLGFPTTAEFTSRIYKNDKALYQDGIVPVISTKLKSDWSTNISTYETLIYRVDSAPAITVEFTDADFQAVDAGSFLNNFSTLDIWANVFNNKLLGVTSVVANETMELSSNLGANNRALIEVIGGSLRDKIFPVADSLVSIGRESDYTLNNQTGQFSLTRKLERGDKLTAGSGFTRAKIITNSIPNGPASSGSTWLILDGDAKYIPSGIKPNTRLDFLNFGLDKLKITGTSSTLIPEGFESVSVGDWLLIWTEESDSTNYPILTNHKGYWRVESVKTGEIIVSVGDNSGYVSGFEPAIPIERMSFVKSTAPIQQLSWPISTVTEFLRLCTQIEGLGAEVLGSKIRIFTKTSDSNGEIYIIASDMGGRSVGFVAQTKIQNITSHLAYIATSDSEASIPTFTHSTVENALSDSEIIISDYQNLGGDVGTFISILNKYSGNKELINSNKGRRASVLSHDNGTSLVTYDTPQYMKASGKIQSSDRFFLSNPYKFDSTDTITVIVDGDAVTKAYTLPTSRKLIVSDNSAPDIQSFSADDLESGLALKDPSSFYDFDFRGFKVWRRSYAMLTDGTYSVRFRSPDFGPAGQLNSIGLSYPSHVSITEATLSSTNNKIDITLPVKTPRTISWSGNTSFTVSVDTFDGKDVATFTYRVGDIPDFSATGSTVNVGDVAIINRNANFLPENKEISARVIAVTPQSFSVELPTGRCITDELECANIVNQNGLVTITTSDPHRCISGDRIGVYGTSNGMDFVGYVTVLNNTTLQIPTPFALLGKDIVTASHINGVVTVTSPDHGLTSSDVILMSDAPITAYNGIHPIVAVPNSNQFQYSVTGSSASISVGKWSSQSYLPELVGYAITTATLASSVVTATTSTTHSLVAGDIVDISSLNIQDWQPSTTYDAGTIVESSLLYYRAKINVPSSVTPPSVGTYWESVSINMNGKFIVQTVLTTTTFTYLLGVSGTTEATNGSLIKYKQSASLARTLGDSAEYLQFAEVTTTAQELVDAINVTYSDFISAENVGDANAVMNKSTADLDLVTNYYTGTITTRQFIMGSNLVRITTTASLPTGSIITLNGTTYTLYKKEIVGTNNIYTVMDSVTHQANLTESVSIPFTGHAPRRMFVDGENFVASVNLSALIGTPMFFCINPWAEAPAIGEEVRLIAQTTDQLVRFWNKLVVSGIANVATIDSSEYGRQIQIMTKMFGSDGSIQVSGGLANNLQVAIEGSAYEYETEGTGAFLLPYQARFGLSAGHWVNINQTVRQNKIIDLGINTVLRAYSNGLEIVSGDGSFQNQRTITATNGSVIKIERHGQFFALIGIGGTALGLSEVIEGDWLEISKYTNYLSWVASTAYTTGQRVVYQGYAWEALLASLGTAPSEGLYWTRLGSSLANEGIYQIVRVFGDTVWFESNSVIEEIFTMAHESEIKFFSYDSIMPNDTLIISGNALGAPNVGRYTVVDATYGTGYQFPTSNRIYTTLIPQATSPVILGDAFNQINIEEKSPLRLWKKIVGMTPNIGASVIVTVDSKNLMNKVSVSLGAQITAIGKLDYTVGVSFGVDSYRYYKGLVAELNKVIYGDPANVGQYPGYRAAGTAIDIRPAVIKKIKLALAVRIRTGIPFSEIRERVKTSAAGYINTLGVGEQVSLSKVIEASSKINGVISVVITDPTFSETQDLIYVGQDQRAQVVDPTSDITVSILGS